MIIDYLGHSSLHRVLLKYRMDHTC